MRLENEALYLQRLAALETSLDGLQKHLDGAHTDMRRQLDKVTELLERSTAELDDLKTRLLKLEWGARLVMGLLGGMVMILVPPTVEHYLDRSPPVRAIEGHGESGGTTGERAGGTDQAVVHTNPTHFT